MRKRSLSLLLAVFMILSLSACKKTAPVPASEAAPAPASIAAEEPSPPTGAEQPWTEPALPAEPGEPEAIHLHPFFVTEQRGYSHPETNEPVIRTVLTKLHLPAEEEKDWPELASAFAEYNKEEAERNEEVWQELYQIFTAMLEEKSSENDHTGGEILCQEDYADCVRADSAVVSFLTSGTSYWGGVHADYYFSGVNFDTKTGKRLALSDVVKDTDAFAKRIDQEIRRQIPKDYNDLFEKPYDYLKGLDLSEPGAVGFTVDNEGVSLYFSPYAIGWFALGAQKAKVYFAEAPELFQEKYAAGTQSYVLPVTEYFPEDLDVDGDGKREAVNVSPRLADKENDSVIYDITCGDRTVTVEDWCYAERSYLVCTGGKYRLYLFETVENDYTVFRVLDLASMEFSKEAPDLAAIGLGFDPEPWCRHEDAGLSYRSAWPEPAFTDPTAFTLNVHTDLLSTIVGVNTYHAGTDGVPVPENAWYDISGNMVILVKEDVKCEEVDASGKKKKDVILSAGTALRFLHTDNETFVDVQTVERSAVTAYGEDDWKSYRVEEMPEPDPAAPVYRIFVDTSSYPKTVNGSDYTEVFEGMLFAG